MLSSARRIRTGGRRRALPPSCRSRDRRSAAVGDERPQQSRQRKSGAPRAGLRRAPASPASRRSPRRQPRVADAGRQRNQRSSAARRTSSRTARRDAPASIADGGDVDEHRSAGVARPQAIRKRSNASCTEMTAVGSTPARASCRSNTNRAGGRLCHQQRRPTGLRPGAMSPMTIGTVNQNVLPLPGVLSTPIRPPISSTKRLQIASPKPGAAVPARRRPSAWENG